MDLKKFVLTWIGALTSFSAFAVDQPPLFDQTILKDNLYFNAELVYGGLYDSQGQSTPFADVQYNNDLSVRTYLPKTNNGWGFKISGGYHLDANHLEDIEVNYLNLQNAGNIYVSGNQLKNLYTQVGVNEVFNYDLGQANVSSNFRYQTANLNKISYHISTSVPSIKNSWIYGIRISGIDKTLNATYSSKLSQNNIDNINYTKSIFGIGPQLGGGSKWALTKYIDISGNITGGVIFGSNTSDWNETVENPRYTAVYPSNTTNYSVHHSGSGWAALVFSGELAGGVHYETSSHDYLKLEGGVYADQYISNQVADRIKNKQAPSNKNTVNFENQFCFRDVFIRFSYRS